MEEVLAFRNAIEQSKTYDAAGMEIPHPNELQEYQAIHTIEETITVLQDYGKI